MAGSLGDIDGAGVVRTYFQKFTMFPYDASPRRSENSQIIGSFFVGCVFLNCGLELFAGQCSLCRVLGMQRRIVLYRA